MSAIDTQNAKKLRDAMQVYITLDAIDDDVALSLSSYQYSPKIYDYTSIQQEYPMRLIADLARVGFPLDDTHELYDSTVAASEANGKIGIRGNVGNRVGLRITSSINITSLTVIVENASTVTCNDESYDATSGSVTIPTGETTSTILYFAPSSSSRRIQIALITSGFTLSFTNEDLISVNLSLRADLKPIDPAFPESEIEVRAYYADDISQMMSTVRDDKPILYQAGYEGDLSPVRKFYLSEPATWNDRVITFKGTDAVSKMNKETFPFFIGEVNTGVIPTSNVRGVFRRLYSAMADQVAMAGVELVNYEEPPAETIDSYETGENICSIVKRQSQRDFFANFINLLHFNFLSNEFSIRSFWPTYVDAGIPTLYWTKPSVKWTIDESECGDISEHSDRKYASITFPTAAVRTIGRSTIKTNGGGTAFKYSGAALEYGDYSTFQIWYAGTPSIYRTETDDFLDLPIDPQWGGSHPYLGSWIYGRALYDRGVESNNELSNIRYAPFFNWVGWSEIRDGWPSDTDETTLSLETYGRGFNVNESTTKYTRNVIGVDVSASKTGWNGLMKVRAARYYIELAPKKALENLLYRSNETGSFTWKGDPRMQPRDFFTFNRLDGTQEVCTVESINLRHEGGGTVATITYRKGMI